MSFVNIKTHAGHSPPHLMWRCEMPTARLSECTRPIRGVKGHFKAGPYIITPTCDGFHVNMQHFCLGMSCWAVVRIKLWSKDFLFSGQVSSVTPLCTGEFYPSSASSIILHADLMKQLTWLQHKVGCKTEYYRCQYLRQLISWAQGCPAWMSSLSVGTVREEWNETLAVRVRWRAWHPVSSRRRWC